MVSTTDSPIRFGASRRHAAFRYTNATSLVADLRTAIAQPSQAASLPVRVLKQEGSLIQVLDGAGQVTALMDFSRLKLLQAAAASNVTFLGHQERAAMRELVRGCKAFLFPGLEEILRGGQ